MIKTVGCCPRPPPARLSSAQVEFCIFCLLCSPPVSPPTVCIALEYSALSSSSPGIFGIFCPCPLARPPFSRPVEYSLGKCYRWWAGQWVGIEASRKYRKCRDCIPDRAKNTKAMHVVGGVTDWDRSRLKMQRLNPRTRISLLNRRVLSENICKGTLCY